MKSHPILISDFLDIINGKSTLSQIFGTKIPTIKTWTDPTEIFTILDIISDSEPSHCALLPGGGHFYLKDVGMTLNSHVDLNDNISHRFLLKSLSFVNFFADDYYFLLESSASKPTGLYSNLRKDANAETVAEFEPGEYIDRKFHDHYYSYEHNFGAYQELYPDRPHLVRRYLKESSVLIVKNDNPYRYTPVSGGGFHDELSPEELKVFMQDLFMQLEITNP